MMLDDALIWYRRGLFTAEDVTRATGLSERSQRELLKIGVLQAVPQAKTVNAGEIMHRLAGEKIHQ